MRKYMEHGCAWVDEVDIWSYMVINRVMSLVETGQNSGEKQPRSLPPALIANKWKPGQSGNPGGRSRSLMTQIRRLTGDGLKLAEYWLKVMEDEKARPEHRLQASQLLADRGWAKLAPELPSAASAGDDPAVSDEALLSALDS